MMLANNILYLASQSPSRRMLLEKAKLPYELVAQGADESCCSREGTLEEVLRRIAVFKMDHVVLPEKAGEWGRAFVVTADTMGINERGEICGKPKNKADAIRMLQLARGGVETGTAFCLDRRILRNGVWEVEQRYVGYANATYVFAVPDAFLESYFFHALEGSSYLQVSGAIAIEEYGLQFVTELQGSFTAVMGLPLFELRIGLAELGFYETGNVNVASLSHWQKN